VIHEIQHFISFFLGQIAQLRFGWKDIWYRSLNKILIVPVKALIAMCSNSNFNIAWLIHVNHIVKFNILWTSEQMQYFKDFPKSLQSSIKYQIYCKTNLPSIINHTIRLPNFLISKVDGKTPLYLHKLYIFKHTVNINTCMYTNNGNIIMEAPIQFIQHSAWK